MKQRASSKRFADLDFDRRVEVVLKCLALGAAGVGGLWTVAEFLHRADASQRQVQREHAVEAEQRAQELKVKRLELNHAFWQQRADTCRQIALTAARVALERGGSEDLDREFRVQYWGAAPIIESPNAEGQASLESSLVAFETRRRSCGENPTEECWNSLLLCATDIARECTRIACSQLDDSSLVDVCASERVPQCDAFAQR